MKHRKRITKKGVFRFFRQMLVSILLLAVFGAVGVYFAYNSKYGNPDDTIKRLFENFYSNNWRMVYDMSDIEEDDFVNYYTYAYVMNNIFEDVNKETVVQGNTQTEGKDVKIEVVYGEGGNSKYVLTLTEDANEKKYMFFPVWNLNLDEAVITDVTVKVPFGYTAELDGISLLNCDSQWLGEEKMIVYHIDRIFAGTHTLQCKRKGREDILVNIELSENGAGYEVDEKDIRHDAPLIDNTVAVVFGLYKNALGNVGIGELESYFINEQKENINAIYNELYNKINQQNGAVLKSFEVTSYDVSNGKTTDTELEMILNFACNYEAKTARSSTSGVRKDYSGSTTSTVKVTYTIIDDVYKISNIEFECIDYSQEN